MASLGRTFGSKLFLRAILAGSGLAAGSSLLTLWLFPLLADGSVLLWALGFLVIGGLVGGIIAASIPRKLAELAWVAHTLASGKTDGYHRLPWLWERGELGEVARSLHELANQLRLVSGEYSGERDTLSAVLAKMDDGIVLVGRDGNVRLLNPAAERILVLGPGHWQGRSFVEVLRDYELIQFARPYLESRSDSTRYGKESDVKLLELGLPRRYLRVQTASLGDGRGLVVLQDLTDIRRAETIRRDFIANVSHELRTPLASLKALAETLQDGALDDPPAAREFLGRMGVEVDGMTQLVRELLELSRIEAGQTALRLAEVEPTQLLQASAERLRAQADRASLDLVVESERDLPRLFVDGERLQQALINLIHNAIKFTPPGGRIMLRASAARMEIEGGLKAAKGSATSLSDFPTHVVLSVSDTGVGIDSADLPRIFERFYKADKARSGGGTGLGLAIAKHIVEAHGGTIAVESASGAGTTFRIALPLGMGSQRE